jgi:predicted MFS family arabinose efflux permease
MATIGDIFADKQRGRAIGVVTSSFAVASTVGLPAGLWLADYFGSWNAPFVAIGTLGVVVWLIALVRLPSLTGHFSLQSSTTQARLSDVLRQPVHLWAFAFMLATVLGTFLIAPFIAPYLQANCGRESMDLPVIYAIAGMCTLITMNLVGWATDRFGAQPVFLFCAGGAVFMTLVITNLPHVTLGIAVLATTCFMTLASGRIIPAQSLMLGASNPSQRGAFMNLTTAVSHFATAIGPLITGSIVGEEYAGGPLTHFALAGLVAAACGCLAVTLSFCMRPFGSPAPSCQPALR